MGNYQSIIKVSEFLEAFQNGVIQDTDIDQGVSPSLLVTKSCVEFPTMDAQDHALGEFSIVICWELPDRLITDFKQDDAMWILLPPLPVEYISEILLQNEQDRFGLTDRFQMINIQEEQLFFRISIAGIRDSELGVDPQNSKYNSKLSDHELSDWAQTFRMARTIAFGLQVFMKEDDQLKANFNIAVHRTMRYLLGDRINPTKKKVDQELRIIEKAFRETSSKEGQKISFKNIRKSDGVGPGDILDAVNEIRNPKETLFPQFNKSCRIEPDRLLLRVSLKSIWKSPLEPESSLSRIQEVFKELETFDNLQNNSDGHRKELRKYLNEAKELVSNLWGGKVRYTNFIAEYGYRSPVLCAIATYFNSDNFADRDRLNERLKKFGAGPAVAWTARVLFGAQNGFGEHLPKNIVLNEGWRGLFKAAANRIIQKSEELDVDTFTDDLINLQKGNGQVRLEAKMTPYYSYFVTITDPFKRLADTFLDLLKKSLNDTVVRRLILQHANDLTLIVLPIFRQVAFPVIKQRNPTFEFDHNIVRFRGEWELSWDTTSEDWREFECKLVDKRKQLVAHIKDHQNTWEKVISKIKKQTGY